MRSSRLSKSYRPLTSSFVGMPSTRYASTTTKTRKIADVIEELNAEKQQKGPILFAEGLKQEKTQLARLEQQRLNQGRESAEKLIQRSQQGYDISGLFFFNLREDLLEKLDPAISDQIDTLRARQAASKQMS